MDRIRITSLIGLCILVGPLLPAQLPVLDATTSGKAELLQQLVDDGVALDVRDVHGSNLLDVALRAEHMDCAAILLEAGLAPEQAQVCMIEYYRQRGDLRKALSLADRQLSRMDAASEQNHSDYPLTLAYKGLILLDEGDLGNALELILQSVSITDAILGKNCLPYGARLNNLGLIYQALGDYASAGSALAESLAIYQSLAPDDYESHVTLMENLGFTYFANGHADECLEILIRAKELYEEKISDRDLNYSYRLNNLGTVYYRLGQYEQAIPLLEKALAIVIEQFGPQHLLCAAGHYNIAQNYHRVGDYQLADAQYLKAIAAGTASLGVKHQEFGWYLSGRAVNLVAMEDEAAALDVFLQLGTNLRFQMTHRLPFLNERLQLNYASDLAQDYDRISSFLVTHPQFDQLVCQNYEDVMLRKGILLHLKTLLLDRLRSNADETIHGQYSSWLDLHTQIADEYSIPLSEREGQLDSLEKEAERIEQFLVTHLPEFVDEKDAPKWEAVRSGLGPGEISIEFDRFNFVESTGQDQRIQYAAYLLRREWPHPRFVPLCYEEDLLRIMGSGKERRADYVSQLYTIPDRGLSPSEEEKSTLYDLIWKPLSPFMEDSRTVFISPAGLLHRIHIGAIPINLDSTLSDVYSIRHIGNTARLGGHNTFGDIRFGKDAFLVGGATYTMDSLAIMIGIEAPTFLDPSGAEMVAALDRGGKNEWKSLPGSLKEVKQVQSVLEAAGYHVSSFSGYSASEDNFKLIEKTPVSPRIIHLATHGYFFEDHPEDEQDTGPTIQSSSNPLMRSGLILAGGNHVWSGNSPVAGLEDGILTAFEICHMDLSGTELVVLSACETGLGEIAGSEGVYGLQRAFSMAGVRYIIMSLWQVPDHQTKDLMTAFYQNWLGSGMSIPVAFRMAQTAMRERFIDPYAWAGFVLLE
ncbi:MAG: CHAT domain-containing protein [Saprospiraceae bacterium]|nr:CHAT domain-containing protein [Saprospiraceae bacterium]